MGIGWFRSVKMGQGHAPMDVYRRAREICRGIDNPGFIAELDQDAMTFRAECARVGISVEQAAKEIFRATDADPTSDRWTHAEAIAAWALRSES